MTPFQKRILALLNEQPRTDSQLAVVLGEGDAKRYAGAVVNALTAMYNDGLVWRTSDMIWRVKS